MLEIVFVMCMTLLALRCLSSLDKHKDAEILRLKKEIKKMEVYNNEQGNSTNQSKKFCNSGRK